MATPSWDLALVADLTTLDVGAPEGGGLGGMFTYGANIQHVDGDRVLVTWTQLWATTDGGSEYFAADNGATIRCYAQVVRKVPGGLQPLPEPVLVHETPASTPPDDYGVPFVTSLEKLDDRLFVASFPIDDHIVTGSPSDNWMRDHLFVLRVEDDDSVTTVAHRADPFDSAPTRISVVGPTRIVRLFENDGDYKLEAIDFAGGSLTRGPATSIGTDIVQFVDWSAIHCQGSDGWIFGSIENRAVPFHVAPGGAISLYDPVTLSGDLPMPAANLYWNYSVKPRRAADGGVYVSVMGELFNDGSGEWWARTWVLKLNLSLTSAVCTDHYELEWQRSGYRPDSDTSGAGYSEAPDGRLMVVQTSDDPNVAPPGLYHYREPKLTIDALGAEPTEIQAPIIEENAWYGVPPYELFEYMFGVDIAATDNGVMIILHGDAADPAYYPDAPVGYGDYSALGVAWFELRDLVMLGRLKDQARRFITP